MTAYRADNLPWLTRVLADAAKEANELIRAGIPAMIEVKEGERGRTNKQNALIHAMLTDISEQCDINGRKFDVVVWKRLCVAQWLKDRGERPQIVPSLDGQEVVVIYEKTSKLNTRQMAELVEWLYSYGAENNVKWSEPG